MEGQNLYLQSSEDQQPHCKCAAVQDTRKKLIKKGTYFSDFFKILVTSAVTR